MKEKDQRKKKKLFCSVPESAMSNPNVKQFVNRHCFLTTYYSQDALIEKNKIRLHNLDIEKTSSNKTKEVFNIKKSDRKSIRDNIVKALLLRGIFGQDFVKCADNFCEMKASYYLLPVLALHHLDPKSKEINISSLAKTFEKLEKNIILLKSKELSLLCNNCHIREHSLIFKKHKKLILDKSLFKLPPTELIKYISIFINQYKPNKKSFLKYEIKKWLKKRSVIEQLFNGTCVGCGIINIDNNLPALSFHHRNPELKKSTWSEGLKYFTISKIIEYMIEEDIICLCSNCHNMIEASTFLKENSTIFDELGRKYHFNYCDSIIQVITEYYDSVLYNIRNFQFPKKKFIDHLDTMYERHRGDYWKKYLIYISIITKKKENNIFTTPELAYSLGIQEIKRNLDSTNPFYVLFEKGFISLVNNEVIPYQYTITDQGINEALKLLKDLEKTEPYEYSKIFKEIKIIPDFRSKHKYLRENLEDKLIKGEGWKKYLIHLLNIVEVKGLNLVYSNELRDSMDLHPHLSFSDARTPMNKLRKENLVIENKSYSSLSNSFSLTDKGYKITKEIQSYLEKKKDSSNESELLRDALKLKLKRSEYLTNHLLHLLLVVRTKELNSFSMIELRNSLGYRQIQEKVKKELIYLGLIKLIEKIGNTNYYALTKKGIQEGKKCWSEIFD